jgi:hypothetical protein
LDIIERPAIGPTPVAKRIDQEVTERVILPQVGESIANVRKTGEFGFVGDVLKESIQAKPLQPGYIVFIAEDVETDKYFTLKILIVVVTV